MWLSFEFFSVVTIFRYFVPELVQHEELYFYKYRWSLGKFHKMYFVLNFCNIFDLKIIKIQIQRSSPFGNWWNLFQITYFQATFEILTV